MDLPLDTVINEAISLSMTNGYNHKSEGKNCLGQKEIAEISAEECTTWKGNLILVLTYSAKMMKSQISILLNMHEKIFAIVVCKVPHLIIILKIVILDS